MIIYEADDDDDDDIVDNDDDDEGVGSVQPGGRRLPPELFISSAVPLATTALFRAPPSRTSLSELNWSKLNCSELHYTVQSTIQFSSFNSVVVVKTVLSIETVV